MKRFLALILAAVLLSGTLPSAGAAFSDMGEVSAQHVEAVVRVSGENVISGFPDGSFKPRQTLTRAQAAKILCSALEGADKAEALTNQESGFSDVPDSYWAAKYIAYCAEKGIVSGAGDGTFRPDDPLTAAAFAKMLLVAYGKSKADKLTGEDWVTKTQKAIRKAKLKDGLDPIENEPTTRENACHMAYNFLTNGAVFNPDSMDTVCGALAYAMGIEPPEHAAAKNETLAAFVDEKLGGQKVDRVFMFNPDAVAQWVYLKYPQLFGKAEPCVGLHLPLCSVMPSVTPVNFGTMYTGAQPEVHGIQKYEKKLITIDSIFDALLRAGKKPVILASKNCSLAKIFNERQMDYFIFKDYKAINAKAAELIEKDEYDFYVVYNGNFDSRMHKTGPESENALEQIEKNCAAFAEFNELIKTHWKGHNTLVGFAMDHGCHAKKDGGGTHGKDIPQDRNIQHFYQIYPKAQ